MDDIRVQQQHSFYIPSNTEQWKAHCTVKWRGDVAWLTDVWCEPDERTHGYATACITAALERYGAITLYLQVVPYGDQPLDDAQLAAWYGHFGFERTSVPSVMVRYPSQCALPDLVQIQNPKTGEMKTIDRSRGVFVDTTDAVNS